MTTEIEISNTLNPLLQKSMGQIHSACMQYGVQQLYIFGSITNKHFNKSSDIDFIVNFKEKAHNQLFDNYMNLHYRLAEITHHKIDLLTEDALKNDPNPYFNKSVDASKILIFNEK